MDSALHHYGLQLAVLSTLLAVQHADSFVQAFDLTQ